MPQVSAVKEIASPSGCAVLLNGPKDKTLPEVLTAACPSKQPGHLADDSEMQAGARLRNFL